jgi:tRNA (cytidine/uridine-2'-O-)-methyltransferase
VERFPALAGGSRKSLPRLIVFSTRATTSYLDHRFEPGDILLFGRESAGLPDEVHGAADTRLVIPMRQGLRSLNVAIAAAIAAGEALRQAGGFPENPRDLRPRHEPQGESSL